MPQKKNPDMAELVRGKSGRVYGDMIGLFTTLKGLPLAYNKDMQEDKEGIFDACETVKNCLDVFCGMIETMKARTDNMMKAVQNGFINATDLADYLVTKGLPFREAYKISGAIVSHCIANGQVLETLPLRTYQTFSDVFAEDLYDAIDLRNAVNRRTSKGGTSAASVEEQCSWLDDQLAIRKGNQ
jgi:argininosuccinate lyase